MDDTHGFRSRLINITTLDTPTRRVVWVGVALLVGLTAATMMRDFMPGERLHVATYIIPSAALVVAAAAMWVVVVLLLAGVSTARSRGRYAAIAGLISLALVLVASDFEYLRVVEANALFFLVAGSALIVFGNRLRWASVLALSMMLCASVASVVIAVSLLNQPLYGATVVVGLAAALAVAVTPALYVVGWDLAEVAYEASASALRKLTEPDHAANRLVALLIVLGIGVALWLGLAHGELTPGNLFFRASAFAGVCMVFSWILVRRRGKAAPSKHVHYLHVLLIAVLLFAADWAEAFVKRDAPGALNIEGAHPFSIVVPEGWVMADGWFDAPQFAATFRDTTRVVLTPSTSSFPRFTILGQSLDKPVRKGLSIPLSLIEVKYVSFQFTKKNGEWDIGSSTIQNAKGEAFEVDYAMRRVETGFSTADARWLVVCTIHAGDSDGQGKNCSDAFESFRLSARLEVDPHVRLAIEELWICLGLLGLTAIAIWPGLLSPLAFFVWAAIVVAMRDLGLHGATVVESFTTDPALSAVIMSAALWLAVVAAFVASVEATYRRSPFLDRARSLAISFLATMLLTTAFFAFYIYAAAGAEHSNAARGALICLALGWEFWTSGASITNHDSAHFPRRSRIMFYLGYLTLVATTVFFFVELPRSTSGPQQAFPTDAYVLTGIACLGVPYAIHWHVRAFLDALRARDSGS